MGRTTGDGERPVVTHPRAIYNGCEYLLLTGCEDVWGVWERGYETEKTDNIFYGVGTP